jgi:error-prone DNA polymerase
VERRRQRQMCIRDSYNAIAITDRNTLAGIVRAHAAARIHSVRLIVGCRLELLDGSPLLAFPTDLPAYGRLSALLSEGNMRTEKGSCHLYKADIYKQVEGIKFVAIPPDSLNASFEFDTSFHTNLQEYRQRLGKNLYLVANRSYLSNDAKRMFRLAALAEQLEIPLIATNDVHYHIPTRRELQDILTCIREKCTIQKAGFRLHQNAERYLKPVEEMQRLFAQYPKAIEQAQELADACKFSLDELKYQYPEEITSDGRTPQEELVYLTWKGANERFDGNIPDAVRKTIEMELEFMERKNYASYFLTVYDLSLIHI